MRSTIRNPITELGLAWSLVVLCGCSGTAHPRSDGGAASEAQGELESLRCTVGAPVVIHPPDILRDVWIARGPDGPRVLGLTTDRSLYWSDGAHSGLATDGSLLPSDGAPTERVLAWTGTRYLSSGEGTVLVRNTVFGDAHETRTALPSSACSPALLEMADRALLTWRRPPHGSTCDTGSGVPWLQVLDAQGDSLGSARMIAPAERNFRMGALHARWDFGRVVLEARDLDHGATRFWVLDPMGVELTRGTSGRVACPRSGCVRVRAVSEAAGSNVDGASQVIRMDPLDGSPGFSTNAPAASVSALVVSGDLVLVLHPEAGEGTGCRGTVIDVGRHAVLASFSEEGLACDEGRVTAMPTGFRVLVEDTGRDLPTLATRAITCTD